MAKKLSFAILFLALVLLGISRTEVGAQSIQRSLWRVGRLVANSIVLDTTNADTTIARTAAGKISLTGTTPMIQLGGTTSSFPALKQNGTRIDAKLADDSAFASMAALQFTFTNGITPSSGAVLFSNGTPSISSGFGTSPSVASNNGATTFRVNVGTGGVATSGVVTMPAATTGWNCQVTDFSNNTVTRETASTTTSVTVTAAAAWAASDTLIFNCAAY